MLRVAGHILKILALMVLGAALAVIVLYILRAQAMPDLEPWHADRFSGDVAAELDDMRGATLATLYKREEKIFALLEEGVRRLGPRGERARWSRYNPVGIANPLGYEINWNRTQELPVEDPRGGALLIHGLSDGPYSTRALAEQLHGMGYHTLVMRMPGHGTVPGALRRATWRDWRAAVRIGARHLAEKVGSGRPLVLVGYSNGAALAVDHTLRALEGEVANTPDQLILVSPAVLAPRVAAFAHLQRWMSMLPGLEKLAWTTIQPEFDPYKYNSFPVMAAEQIHLLTSQLQERLAALDEAGRLADFPPVLVFQSVVDATIAPISVIDGLLDRLPDTGSALVLFDVNREAQVEVFLSADHEALIALLRDRESLPFDYTLVTNADEFTDQVVARTRRSASREWGEVPLDLAWPGGIFSLSHVAMPFAPDDPLYGVARAGEPTHLRLGSLAWRGERGVFGVSMDQLARLRFNPFYDYVEARVEAALYSRPR